MFCRFFPNVLRGLSSAREITYRAAMLLAVRAQHSSPSASSPQDVLEPEAYNVGERRAWVLANIERALEDPTRRLFAVIYIQGKQFKVMQDDVIHIEHNIPLAVGDEIKLEKVLMVGGVDFSLIGRPLLDPRHAHVRATVIEKTTTSPEVQYNFRIQSIDNPMWLSQELTVLRINNIVLDKAMLGEP